MSSETNPEPDEPAVAATLDAGEQNCATLILNVRQAIRELAHGEILEVIAYDPSAQLDLEAWTRMTGHSYLGMDDRGEYAIYLIQKGAR